LYIGAFTFYLNRAQFQLPLEVRDFCDYLIKDWESLPPELTDHISMCLKEAWEKEISYGKNNPIISPFGNNQREWYKVLEHVLGIEIPPKKGKVSSDRQKLI